MTLKQLRVMLFLGFLLIGMSSFTSVAQTDELDFTDQGPYGVGLFDIVLVDANRDNRELPVFVWYPTDPPSRRRSTIIPSMNADLFTDVAPYPLVIFSAGACLDARDTQDIGTFLASFSFVVVSAQHEPTPLGGMMAGCPADDPLGMVQRPFDISFILDTIEAGGLTPFDDQIDLERVGVSGYSYGGYAVVVAAGAQVNGTALPDYCISHGGDNICGRKLDAWESITALYESVGETDDEGYWVSLNDPRVDAVAAQAPCLMPVTGSDGIVALSVPALIFSVTGDEYCPPERDAARIFNESTGDARYWLEWTGTAPEYSEQHLVFRGDDVKVSVRALEIAFFYSQLVDDSIDFDPYLASLLQDPSLWTVQVGE